MRNIQPGMNIPRQRQKLTHLAAQADSQWKRDYLTHLLGKFDQELAAGRPTPASEFIPMYQEEFGE